jgi:hypothetical protein
MRGFRSSNSDALHKLVKTQDKCTQDERGLMVPGKPHSLILEMRVAG